MIPSLKNSVAGKISVKSAVNPSLWACVVISLPLFYSIAKVDGWLQVAFFIVAVIPIVAFLISYIYLLFKNPDYLRSEEYQLRAESLKLLGDRDNQLNADADDIVSVINNPRLPSPDSIKKKTK